MMSVEELKRRFPGMDVHPRLVFHVGRYLYLKHIYRRVSDGKILTAGRHTTDSVLTGLVISRNSSSRHHI